MFLSSSWKDDSDFYDCDYVLIIYLLRLIYVLYKLRPKYNLVGTLLYGERIESIDTLNYCTYFKIFCRQVEMEFDSGLKQVAVLPAKGSKHWNIIR
jgi:hypothetical protein